VNKVVEAYVTLVMLMGMAVITGLMLHMLPESWKEWLIVKLQLDKYEPYDEIDED
jgi:hypothetical protein